MTAGQGFFLLRVGGTVISANVILSRQPSTPTISVLMDSSGWCELGAARD